MNKLKFCSEGKSYYGCIKGNKIILEDKIVIKEDKYILKRRMVNLVYSVKLKYKLKFIV